MNFMPTGDSFAPDEAIVLAPDTSAERAVIAACLVDPQRVGQILGRIDPRDFYEPLHGDILATLARLIEEGRTPSLESLIAVGGNREVAPGETLRDYLLRLLRGSVTGVFGPWQDSVEVVREQAQRRAMAGIGHELLARAAEMSLAPSDIAAEAVTELDTVIAASRKKAHNGYTAFDAAAAAMAHHGGEGPRYPTTGLIDLDNRTGGWPRGQLSIVAGRPGAGKSAAATGFMLRAAAAGHGVAFFSLEMQREQLGARILTDLAFDEPGEIVVYQDILKRKPLTNGQTTNLSAANDRLDALPIHIEEQRGLSLAEITARTRKIAAEFDRSGRSLDVVIVDHIGLVRASSRYAGNRVRELAEISDGLATLAKDLDVAVVALCQINRGVEGRENKRPQLSDLRESGAIEEDASLVMFIYRPAYYLENTRFDDFDAEDARIVALENCRNKIEFLVSKNRNGATGTVDAFVDIRANAIRDQQEAR